MQALMTEELSRGLPPLQGLGGENDPVAYVHYFSQLNGWDWYLVAYDAETDEAYGLVCGAEAEWGFFSIVLLAVEHA